MTDVVIVSAARTPVGSFLGALSTLPASKLGEVAIKAALERAGVAASDVDEVILGQVLQAGAGQGPARQAAIGAGLANETPAWSLNQLCGSGLRAVALAYQQIVQGDARIVVAGGQESMSQSPHTAQLRNGQKMGELAFKDSMLQDGLIDAFHGYHMGQTAENIAAKWSIDRASQDAFAVASQNKAEAAQKAGKFADEIVPVVIATRKGDVVVDQDEYIRHGATLEAMEKLKPAFVKDGAVTAANSSSISDGAAAMVMTRESTAKALGLPIVARVVSHAAHAHEPALFTTAPVPAMQKALKKAGWSVEDVDLWEVNEAFAVVAMIAQQELGIDRAKLNVNGGATALGHPIGASGARILSTLLAALQARGGKKGVASLCIGGGEAVAMAVELV